MRECEEAGFPGCVGSVLLAVLKLHALVPTGGAVISPSETSPDTKDADDANGSRSDPLRELCSASVLAIDLSALHRAYLSDRVCAKVGVKGIDGAAAREAGRPALSPAKLASNFARSTARFDDNACLDSLLIFFPPATAEPPASGGRPDLDMALDICRYYLDPEPPPSQGKTATIDSYTCNPIEFTKN